MLTFQSAHRPGDWSASTKRREGTSRCPSCRLDSDTLPALLTGHYQRRSTARRRRAFFDRVRFEFVGHPDELSVWGAIYGDEVHVHADHRSDGCCERWKDDVGRDQPGSSAARRPCPRSSQKPTTPPLPIEITEWLSIHHSRGRERCSVRELGAEDTDENLLRYLRRRTDDTDFRRGSRRFLSVGQEQIERPARVV